VNRFTNTAITATTTNTNTNNNSSNNKKIMTHYKMPSTEPT